MISWVRDSENQRLIWSEPDPDLEPEPEPKLELENMAKKGF